MWIRSVRLQNYRGYADSGLLKLGRQANLLVGPNNSGKSAVIHALYRLQEGSRHTAEDVRLGTGTSLIEIELEDLNMGYVLPLPRNDFAPLGNRVRKVRIENGQPIVANDDSFTSNRSGMGQVSQFEPQNFFYPFLARRKAEIYSEDVNTQAARSVVPSLRHVAARVDAVANPAHPAYEAYVEACRSILGFVVTASNSMGGKRAGLVVDAFNYVPLDVLGEGVANVVGFLSALCLAEHKVFLIEEPENDIHPRALKRLLDVVVATSHTNQFIISTHSNIVVRYLGGLPDSTLYYVESTIVNGLPHSACRRIGEAPVERRAILEELGYDLLDFDLWEGWLIFEESSAERIVREHLIRWFAPRLVNRVRALSAGGITEVELRFHEFQRLFTYVHLASTVYLNRAWVFVDGDETGKATVDQLRTTYVPAGWNTDNFRSFSAHDFEDYYPAEFQEGAKTVLGLANKKERWERKKQLLEQVLSWISEDDDRARKAFAQSAAEVIGLLQEVEAQLEHLPAMRERDRAALEAPFPADPDIITPRIPT